MIDEWEMFEHEHECSVSCFNCEHKRVAPREEPCASCRNRNNWKERRHTSMKKAILEGIGAGLMIGAIGCIIYLLWVYCTYGNLWGYS